MKKTVLVSEDDQDIAGLIQEIIGRKGYEAVLTKDGQQAYEEFKRRKYDLVVTDLKMPRLDGLSLVKLIRETDKEVPIVIITGYGSEKNRALLKSYGVEKILSKPCTVKEISEAIGNTIGK
ncbi:MAG: response regulator [Spirochaetes bacterium]|nr:response regulator [Spirochaetota bacterium]